MAARYAWVLNLDADFELAAAVSYAPRQRVLEAMAPHVEYLQKTLMAPSDLLAEEWKKEDGPALGRAFCPTARALAIMKTHGIEPEPHPSFEVLRRVNSRAFSSALGATLPDGEFFTDEAAAIATLRRAPAIGRAWRIKRTHGMAGRGQCVVTPGAPTAHDLAFVRAGMAEGGVQIEPQLAIAQELGIHGMLAEGGRLRLGSVVTQRSDARGAWLGTERLPKSDENAALSARLQEEAERVAAALHRAGYFGPFGVDAFTFEGKDGTLALQPRSEINARYSMGFSVGFDLSKNV